MIKVDLDDSTATLLIQLKRQLRVNTNEKVVRKAIALLAQVVDISGNERYFFLKTPTGEEIKINLD